MTIHANFSEAGHAAANPPPEDIALYARVLLRFSSAGTPMPVILEEFSYAATDPAKTAEYQSAIVRQTILDHGGTITAANAPGGGAVFTVTLPAESA